MRGTEPPSGSRRKQQLQLCWEFIPCVARGLIYISSKDIFLQTAHGNLSLEPWQWRSKSWPLPPPPYQQSSLHGMSGNEIQVQAALQAERRGTQHNRGADPQSQQTTVLTAGCQVLCPETRAHDLKEGQCNMP